ncbi:MAG: hypothetical protein AAB316_04310 [Bacteroidota bacterium]
MKNFLLKILIFAAAASIGGCYYDNEEELYPDTGGDCDLANVTYGGTILPILQSNCFSCHDAANNNGGVTLEGYANLKIWVNNGYLLGAIRHESSFAPMPQGETKLLDCTIQKIEKWVSDGAPNN